MPGTWGVHRLRTAGRQWQRSASCITAPTAVAIRKRRVASTKIFSACCWPAHSKSTSPRADDRRKPCPPSSASTTAPSSLSSKPKTCPSSSRRSTISTCASHLKGGHNDLDPMLAKVRAAGLEVRGVSHHGFVDSVYFRDPNDHMVGLCVKAAVHDAEMNPAPNDARKKRQRWQARRTTGPLPQHLADGRA